MAPCCKTAHKTSGMLRRITEKAVDNCFFFSAGEKKRSGGVVTLSSLLRCLITACDHEYFRHMLSHFVIGVQN